MSYIVSEELFAWSTLLHLLLHLTAANIVTTFMKALGAVKESNIVEPCNESGSGEEDKRKISLHMNTVEHMPNNRI